MKIRAEKLVRSAGGHYLLLPNLNRSGSDLPSEITAASLQSSARLDLDLPLRKLSDREIYALLIAADETEVSANQRLTLKITFAPQLFTIINQSGIAYQQLDGQPLEIDLTRALLDTTKIGGFQIYVEARTFSGSPLLDADASQTIQFQLLNEKGETLQTFTTFDLADLRPANIILLGDQARPERLFMGTLDENQPSVLEFREAARQAAVPLTLMPDDVGLGDTWLQDQFQLGYTASGRSQMQVILHLPRMVNAAALRPNSPNLKNFVEHYFPSHSIGLFNDFWAKKISVNDGNVAGLKLSVAQSYPLYKELNFVLQVLRFLFREIERVDSTQQAKHDNFPFEDLYAVRLEIDASFRQLSAYPNLKDEQRSALLQLNEVIRMFTTLSPGNISTLSITDGGVELKLVVDDKSHIFLYIPENKQELTDMFKALNELHSSGNYGGNIEVSPPTTSLPFGKIFTGTVRSPEISHFLEARAPLQPLASAYTAWLKVGHIDELIAFVTDGAAPDGFSIVRAAPRLAVTLLEQLHESQTQGLLVTRLLRGKKWLHEGLADIRSTPHPPPAAYLSYVKNQDQRYDLSGFIRPIPPETQTDYFDSAYHDDRRFMIVAAVSEIKARYAALISCADLLSQTRSTNRAADDLFITGKLNFADDVPFAHYATSKRYKKDVVPGILDKALAANFESAPVFRLPVLFDFVENFGLSGTKAVIPAAVNLQTLNQHLIVPRPYGPRMRPADAVGFMLTFLEREGESRLASFARRTLTEQWISRQGLDLTIHWTRAGEQVAVAHAGRRPTEFDPDFKEMWFSIYQSIFAATSLYDVPSYYEIIHRNDPYLNHPISIPEDLAYIANCFKDGFDEFKNIPVDYCKGDSESSHPRQDDYDNKIIAVMERIRQANPGVFNQQGEIIAKQWTRLTIPENTVDIFELYTHLALSMLGASVHWVDSWYYHILDGGLHCATNVLRSP